MVRENINAIPPEAMKEKTKAEPIFDWQNGTVPESEVRISATRSGGPGGQGVNTTSSKVEARWRICDSPALSENQKQTLRAALRNRVNRDDELVVTSETERSQKQNKQEALEKLSALVRDALTPEEERIPTHKPKGVKARERRAKEADRRRKVGRGKVTDW